MKRLLTNLILAVLLGLFPVIIYFQVPSMERNAVFFGFSLSRFLIGAVFVFLLFLMMCTAAVLAFHRTWRKKLLSFIDHYLMEGDRLLILTYGLGGVVISGFVLFWWVGLETTIDLNTFVVIFGRLRWMLTWGLVVGAQLLTFLVINYRSVYRQKGIFHRRLFLTTFLIIFFFDSSLFHWIILTFEIQIFASIPYWTWFFHLKKANYLIVLIELILALTGVLYILKRPGKKWVNILVLIVLGYVLQMGYGFVEGNGIQSIKKKTTSAGHVWYLEHAVDNLDLADVVFNYEESFGSNLYLGTKPPGVLIFYLLNQKLSFMINPVQGYQARFALLLDFITYLFPFFTFLTIPLIIAVGKKFFDSRTLFIPAILFLFLPNIILMPIELDQVLFPILFMTGLFFTLKTIETYSLHWAFITGLMLYISVYFTFALLPLIPISVLWLVLDYWIRRRRVKFTELLKIGLFMGVGFLVLFLIGQFILNYDILLRYKNAMIKHRTLKEYEPGINQVIAAIKLNNIEIAAWIGFPIALLCIVRVLRSIKAFILKHTSALDILSISFFLVYLLLNILGQTRGEVGRLWLFMTPLFVIFAAYEIVHFFRNQNSATIYLVLLQFITIFLTFRFQDFW